MELRQLEQFVAVAEEGQFTRAATRCTIAQSALSTSIRALERELGAALFVRTTRRVALTAAGRALLTEARRTLAAAAAARTAVHDVQALVRGTLNVGGIPTFSLLDQPALLQRFRTRHPGVEIRYIRNASTALIEDVREARLDAAFISLPNRPPAGLTVREIASSPAVFVCRNDHPLADRTQVGLEELAGECFVGMPPGSIGYQAIDRVFAASGTERQVPFEVNDVAAMLDFIEHGIGVTLMVKELAANRPQLCTIPLAESGMVWRLGVIAPPDEQITPAARALLDLLEQSPELGTPPLRSVPLSAGSPGHQPSER
jgi:DNA-binding transcriptional LysR family regulator